MSDWKGDIVVRREVSLDMTASPDVLWDMVSDVTRMGEWSPETERAEWLDGAAAPAPGARFKGHNRKGRTKWSTTCEVTAAEPEREFTFAVGGAKRPSAVWSYRFEALGEGGTRVTESFELPKPLSRVSRLVTRLTTGVKDREADLEAGMRTTLQRIDAAATAAPS